VFTLPHELGPLALRNRKLIFDMLFSAAARTLLELGMDECSMPRRNRRFVAARPALA
jgi:hypothetical protein